RGEWTVGLADHGRREDGPELVARRDLHRLSAQLGCEVDQIVDRSAVLRVRGGLGRHRLSWRIPFARHLTFLDRLLLDRPDRLPPHAIEDAEGCLLSRAGER